MGTVISIILIGIIIICIWSGYKKGIIMGIGAGERAARCEAAAQEQKV